MASASALERAVTRHRHRWGAPQYAARAPGRVNLIGEHTDYNDGFTLPMALPFDTVVTFQSIGDPQTGVVTIDAAGFGEIDLRAGVDVPPWARHLLGVVELMEPAGVASRGWRGCIESDIPTGASLSSSAALEVAMIRALLTRADLEWSPVDIARLGQRVENEVVGIRSGIMDQLISAGAVAGHAGLMDCRALTLTPVRIPDDVAVAIMDTRTRRVLAEAAYDQRRAACERAASALGVVALRNATLDDLDRIDDATDRRRARHVITESARVLAAIDRLSVGDTAGVGSLMTESHESLRDDYEVSGPGLDAIVDVARDAPGCLGARMTGGGFAGCAVALVRADRADAFAADVVDRYDHSGLTAEVWICEPSAGASIVR
jgi:galactokinase